MSLVQRRGPCHIFVGDPTTASGADMQYVGYTRGDVVFSANLNISRGFADQTGLTPLAESVRDVGATPVLTVPMIDEEFTKMLAYMQGATQVTNTTKNALGFSSGPAAVAIADVPTVALIPLDEIADGTNGIDSANAIWLPRAIAVSVGDFTHNNEQSDDDFNPHTVEFHALYSETDQDGSTINAALRRGFIGTPNADTGLTWSLPAVAV